MLFSKDDLIIIPDGGDSEGLCIEIEKKYFVVSSKNSWKTMSRLSPDEGINAHLAACDLAPSFT